MAELKPWEKDLDQQIKFRIKRMEEAEMDILRQKDHLETLRNQRACQHKNLDSRGVFGTTCNDCDYFFNDGF